jgi:hypothetical protein
MRVNSSGHAMDMCTECMSLGKTNNNYVLHHDPSIFMCVINRVVFTVYISG